MGTALDTSIFVGQLGHIADHQVVHDYLNALTGRRVVAGTVDFPTLADTTAALVTGDILVVRARPTIYSFGAPLIVPSVHVDAYGALAQANAAAATFRFDAPVERIIKGLHVDGADLTTTPLVRLGTGNQGAGSKVGAYDLHIEGSANVALAVLGLQNSNFFNCRLVDNNAANTGWLIDEGSKNINLFGCWGSSVTGYAARFTTTGNMVGPGSAQRTSKVTVWGGLFERSNGFAIEDVEELTLRNVIINANAAYSTAQALHLKEGGLRDGVPHGPTGVVVEDCQLKDWDVAAFLDGPFELRIGNSSLGTCDVNYKISHAAAKVLETSPQQSDAPVRYDGGATGVIEQHAIRRLYYTPRTIPLMGGPITWALMPAAATELGGDDDFRTWADIYMAKFVRFGVHVDTAGSAGAKLQLWYRTTDGGFGAGTTQRLGTNEVQTIALGGATGGSFTLTFDGQTTTAINVVGITDTIVNAALVALSNISPNGVATDGTAANGFTVTFGAEYAGIPVSQITVTDSTTGGTGVVMGTTVQGVTTEVLIDATGTLRSGWVTIAEAPLAAIDVMLIVGGITGDGIANPVLSNAYVELS